MTAFRNIYISIREYLYISALQHFRQFAGTMRLARYF